MENWIEYKSNLSKIAKSVGSKAKLGNIMNCKRGQEQTKCTGQLMNEKNNLRTL